MKRINSENIAVHLTNISNVEIRSIGSNDTSFSDIRLRSGDLEHQQGFIFDVSLKWKRLEAIFKLENFAGELLQTMHLADAVDKQTVTSLLRYYASNNREITLSINGQNLDFMQDSFWPETWDNFRIEMIRSFQNIDGDIANHPDAEKMVIDLCCDLLSLVLPLLPIEEIDDSTELPESEIEGAMFNITSSRYERSAKNRLACIAYHGYKCAICGFDFEGFYGSIGRDYIHVHHLTPLSLQDGAKRIDPIEDLVPVCPNCHAMLHKRNPPYSLEELRKMIEEVDNS